MNNRYYDTLSAANIANKTQHLTQCSEAAAVTVVPLQRYAPTLSQLTLLDMYILIRQANIASITARSLALDAKMGPHISISMPNCTDCPGALVVDDTNVQATFSGALPSHFAAAKADLTRFGGSPAHVIAVTSLGGSINHTIQANFMAGFKADWNATSSRYGIVIEWSSLVRNNPTIASR